MPDDPYVTRSVCDSRNGGLWTEVRVIRSELNDLKFEFGKVIAVQGNQLLNIENNQRLAAEARDKQSEELKEVIQESMKLRANRVVVAAIVTVIVGLLGAGASISQIFSVVHK